MPASDLYSTHQAILHGSGTSAFAVAATLAVVGIGLAVWYPLAWVFFSVFCIGGIILFSIIGIHRRTTTLEVDANELVETSWFNRRRIALANLDLLSLRTTIVGRSLAHSIVCWSQNGKELGEIDTTPYPRAELRDLIQTMQQRQPRIQVDRELQRFLSTNRSVL